MRHLGGALCNRSQDRQPSPLAPVAQTLAPARTAVEQDHAKSAVRIRGRGTGNPPGAPRREAGTGATVSSMSDVQIPLSADPGGIFVSNVHRRVTGHLPLPGEEPTSVTALVARLAQDAPHTPATVSTDPEQLGSILGDLQESGDAVETDGDWGMTQQGFDKLTGPIADEPPAPPTPPSNGGGPGLEPAPIAPAPSAPEQPDAASVVIDHLVNS